ncbi:MAG TPA: hypothetical protein VG796_02735 [Verrucomicrobiales bacterium]|nr:hypothetical protein [Verrucomicrobiales bacterium]
MKPTLVSFIRTASAALVLAVPAMAQEIVKETVRETTGDTTERTTTTTTTGTIDEFGNDRIVIHSETSEDPITYSFTKSTTYVDETGAPVSIETVKSGLPVTIHYAKVDNGLVAKKVVVKKTKTRTGGTTETKTTTTTGTINEFGDNRLVIRTERSTEPIRYRYTKTTTYVDEAGKPVSMELVKSGLPVTVYYTNDAEGPVATKVVVKKTTTTPGRARTTETTKTTTTMGTVSDITDNRLVIRTETATEPVSYTFTKTTTYVDEAGAPVDFELVKSGLPVTVQYTRDGDTLVADKVIVRKKTTTVVPRQ